MRTCGEAVFSRSVYGSTTFTSTMGLVKVANDEGLFGTLGMRFSVNTTSSAVKGEPSCHFTFLRSLISQVTSSTALHEVASDGTSLPFGSRAMSDSKTCSIIALFGERLW